MKGGRAPSVLHGGAAATCVMDISAGISEHGTLLYLVAVKS